MKRALFAIFAVLALAGVALALFSQVGPNQNAAQIAQANAYGEMAGALQIQALTNLAGQCLTGALLVFFFIAGAGVGLVGLVLWVRQNATQAGLPYALPGVSWQALNGNQARIARLPEPQTALQVLQEEPEPEDILFRGWGGW